MKERVAQLHETVLAALVEADAIRDLGGRRSNIAGIADVGICLDRAREVLERMVWPDRSSDHRPLQ